MKFIDRLKASRQRRKDAAVDDRREYFRLVTMLADQGELGTADAPKLEKLVEALAIEPEQVEAHVRAWRRADELRPVAEHVDRHRDAVNAHERIVSDFNSETQAFILRERAALRNTPADKLCGQLVDESAARQNEWRQKREPELAKLDAKRGGLLAALDQAQKASAELAEIRKAFPGLFDAPARETAGVA